jgi:hypothetical protein
VYNPIEPVNNRMNQVGAAGLIIDGGRRVVFDLRMDCKVI